MTDFRHEAMGQAGPDYNNLSFEHQEHGQWGKPTITAHHPDYGNVGSLRYTHMDEGDHYATPEKHIEVEYLHVDDEHKRRGVASQLMNHLDQMHPRTLINHGDRTEDGSAWAKGHYQSPPEGTEHWTRGGRTVKMGMGQAGPDYTGLSFHEGEHPLYPADSDYKTIFAHHPDHGEVGRLTYRENRDRPAWTGVPKDFNSVTMMHVPEEHRRRGVADQLMNHFEHNVSKDLPIEHGSRRPDGNEWAKSHYSDPQGGKPNNFTGEFDHAKSDWSLNGKPWNVETKKFRRMPKASSVLSNPAEFGRHMQGEQHVYDVDNESGYGTHELCASHVKARQSLDHEQTMIGLSTGLIPHDAPERPNFGVTNPHKGTCRGCATQMFHNHKQLADQVKRENLGAAGDSQRARGRSPYSTKESPYGTDRSEPFNPTMRSMSVQTPPDGMTFEHTDTDTGGSKHPVVRQLRAVHPEHGIMGSVDYYPPKRSNGVATIDSLYVNSDHRRKGVGAALMDEVQRMHPQSTINHGDRTEDGKAWWKGYTDGKSVTRGRTAKFDWDEEPCTACSGTGEQGTGHECYQCDGTGLACDQDTNIDNANPENGLLVGRNDAKGIKPQLTPHLSSYNGTIKYADNESVLGSSGYQGTGRVLGMEGTTPGQSLRADVVGRSHTGGTSSGLSDQVRSDSTRNSDDSSYLRQSSMLQSESSSSRNALGEYEGTSHEGSRQQPLGTSDSLPQESRVHTGEYGLVGQEGRSSLPHMRVGAQQGPLSGPIGEGSRKASAQASRSFTPKLRIFAHTCGLDHRLFDGEKLRPEVRRYILRTLGAFWLPIYGPGWDRWSKVYFAGSEASEWTSDMLEGNNDFDVLVGVDYAKFRDAVPQYAYMTDEQLTAQFNQQFKLLNNPNATITVDKVPYGPFDNTWYVNQDSYNIKDIKPYAAYNVSDSRWAVKPPHLPHWSLSELPRAVQRVLRACDALANDILKLPEPERTQQGAALFEAWHSDRSRAFSQRGEGWYDIANLREKWLDQEGTWAELVGCAHRWKMGEGLAPTNWSNTPPGYKTATYAEWARDDLLRKADGISDPERKKRMQDHAHDTHDMYAGFKKNPVGQQFMNGDRPAPVGWVKTEHMLPYAVHHGDSSQTSPDRVKHLKEEFESGKGFNSALDLHYHPESHTARIEGNHRLEAARQAGLTHVPVMMHIDKEQFQNEDGDDWKPATFPKPAKKPEGYIMHPANVLPKEWLHENSRVDPTTPHTASVEHPETPAEALTHVGRQEHPNVDHYRSGGIGHMEGDETKSVVGFMPVSKTLKFAEHHGDQHHDSRKVIDSIKADIAAGKGITNPIMMEYNHKTKRGYIGEGNHRLQAAHESGLKTVPMRVVRSGFTKNVGAPMELQTNFGERDPNYVPSDIHPHHFLKP